jgi:hypothetical protein
MQNSSLLLDDIFARIQTLVKLFHDLGASFSNMFDF